MKLNIEKLTGVQLNQNPRLFKTLRTLTLYNSRRMEVGLIDFLELLQHRTENRVALIARTQGGIVGWCSLHMFRRDKATIVNFFVLPERRRLGIASALMSRAQVESPYSLEVVPHDRTSYAFFKKHGMQGAYNDVVGEMVRLTLKKSRL